jgi:hypothetical protein
VTTKASRERLTAARVDELGTHLRSSRYSQRERPASTIPARIASLRTGAWARHAQAYCARKEGREQLWQMSWDAEGALLLEPLAD